jgi:Fe-S cluster assembly ATP-binding protein
MNERILLQVTDLVVEAEGQSILKGLSLTIKPGEVHAIMGPNGSGKSTLSKVIAGDPEYTVVGGSIQYEVNGKMIELLELEADERAQAGIFLGFQYPVEIPGVSNSLFLRTALNQICKAGGIPEVSQEAFDKLLAEKMKMLNMKDSFATRELNVDFSGGEKKRNEILQMAVLSPRLAFLDETDSGLDVDSLKNIGENIAKLKTSRTALVLVTHYQRLLDYVVPDVIHILSQGRIVKTGSKELAHQIEASGFEAFVK